MKIERATSSVTHWLTAVLVVVFSVMTVPVVNADAAAVRDAANRLEIAAGRFAETARIAFAKDNGSDEQDLLASADWFESLTDEMKQQTLGGVVNGDARDTLQQLTYTSEKVSGLMKKVNASSQLRSSWKQNLGLLERFTSGKAQAASSNKTSEKKGSAVPDVVRGHVDQIEDAAEQTKNAYRAHLAKHGEIRSKAWAKKLAAALGAFDQDANALRDALKASGRVNAEILQRMNNRSDVISNLISANPAGGETRIGWQRVMKNLSVL